MPQPFNAPEMTSDLKLAIVVLGVWTVSRNPARGDKRWYNSPEYKKILPGRLDSSTARGFIVEGVS